MKKQILTLRNAALVFLTLLTGIRVNAQCSGAFSYNAYPNAPFTIFAQQPWNSNADGICVWNWGDGSPNDTTYDNTWAYPSITHNYPAVGVYTVCINYSSVTAGCNVSSCQNFTVTSMTLPAKSININSAAEYPGWGNCPQLPASCTYYFSALVQGYTPSDSLTAQVFFGDGTDTMLKMPPYFDSSGVSYISNWISHTVSIPGLYSAMYRVVDNALTTGDTVTNYNSVDAQDSCGNLNGTVYLDVNANCVYDPGVDSVLTGLWVTVVGTGNYSNYSGQSNGGFYNTTVPVANSYTLTIPFLGNHGYAYACGGAGLSGITAPATVNIGVVCPSGFDLTGDLWGWRFRPGDSAYVFGQPYNYSCLPQSGTATITLDPNTTFMSEVFNNSVNSSGNQVSWSFSNIVGFNYWSWGMGNARQLKVSCSTNLQIGDSVCFTLSVDPTSGDVNPANNTVTECFEVRNSWDPNYKEVYPRGTGALGLVAPNTEFNYTIHFQNNGNDTAYNIAVLDTIDADLDLSSFQLLSSSHNVQPQSLGNGVIKFHFNNIMLPDSATDPMGSQGWFSYSIKAKPNQPNGTQYTNTAYIYFDFNPAIVTNTTLNTIGLVGIQHATAIIKSATLVPNPSAGYTQLVIQAGAGADEIKITVCDMLGQEVQTQPATLNSGKNIVSLPTEKLPAGMYLVNISGRGGPATSLKLMISK